MKVRTRIIVLLFVIVAIFAGGLVAIKNNEARQLERINAERGAERTNAFDKFRDHWSEPLATFTRDYAAWNDTVLALQNNNRSWAEKNLHDDLLASYRTHFVWLYRADATLFFSHNLRYDETIVEAPLPREEIEALLKNRSFSRFFAQTPLGLMEVRGASVHPSRDSGRHLPAAGYLFAGRLWTSEDLREIELITGYTVQLVEPTDHIEPVSDARTGTVRFTRPLPGFDGEPVAALLVTNESPALKKLTGSTERAFLWLIAFLVIVFLLISVALTRWVTRPLRLLADALKRQKPEPLQRLKNDGKEFGDLARLVAAFFQQREKLVHEMEERRQTEEALHSSEEQLRHSQKMEAVGRLAGGIAHDFNNLLTAIIGYSDLLATRLSSDSPSKQYAELIHKAGEQAAALTRQLLAFSRKQLLQPRVVDLNSLVGDMEKLLQRVIGEHIHLRVETSAAPGRVRADPAQLEQVIVNLGVNARDAMPRGGVLTIHTSNVELDATDDIDLPPGRYIALCVSDNGSGMDAQTKERIFEPFFTTKEAGKGTGLGLATVYGIVRQSGGAISVESTPGDGTDFTIFLPEENAPVDPSPAPESPVEKTHMAETLLVVEDEEIVRELVCAVLTEQGYEVLCAPDGPAGLRLAREFRGRIHLLITDVIMPQMNGPELARQIQEARPETRVLFVSGYSNNDIADHGELPPEINFLEKPFTPEVLACKVQAVLHEEAASVPVGAS